MDVDFFHRSPLAHQLRDFERFKDAPCHALFHEQRVRKTKIELDIFRYRALRGDVDALVVIAHPNGVHLAWLDELAKDFPPDFLASVRSLGWEGGKMTKGARREAALALRSHFGPIVFTMNCEALGSAPGWKYVQWLLAKRRVMLVADESSWAANWSGRTRRLLTLGGWYSSRPNVVVKAILDGTPVDEGPEDVYYPSEFLRPGLLGYPTKAAFRARYCEFETDPATGEPKLGRRFTGVNHATGEAVYREFPIFRGYRNLDELRGLMAPWSSRVLRRDVSDAPEKTYQSRFFELTLKQRKVYDRLRDQYVAELSDGVVTVANILTRMTRLQMIARNFYPPERAAADCVTCFGSGFLDTGESCDVCGGLGAVMRLSDLERIDARNPAIDALIDELHVTHAPVVVWCRFVQDVKDATMAAFEIGRQVGTYYGMMSPAEREATYREFRDGALDVIVATIKSGLSRGHDLSRAGALIYYSNEFSRRDRSQSEDRAETLDRVVSTDVVDLVAIDTRDEDVIAALRRKASIAALVTGDPPGKWL